MQYRIVNISADQFECSCPWAYFSQSVESAPVTQMNFQWREGVYHKCALYEELIRDDCKVLGCIMRFYQENCRRRNVSVPKRTTRQHAGPWKRPYSDMPSFFEPVRNLLHRGDQDFATGEPAFRPTAAESLHR